jgi:hypothetical protein
MADRGLAEPQAPGSCRRAAMAHQFPEDEQQPAIDPPDIILVDISHEPNSVSRFHFAV